MIESIKRDFVIVGSGLAGLMAAIKASDYGSVFLITKNKLELSSSFNAQGGIAAAVDPDDDPVKHLKDTLVAGRGICNYHAVKTLVFQGKSKIEKLISEGLPFDRNNGKLTFSLEGGHSNSRVLHLNGTNTGKYVTSYFIKKIKNLPNIEIFENGFAFELLKDEKGIAGVLAIDLTNGTNLRIIAPVVILATGGYSRIYGKSTNPVTSLGDGIWLAYNAGAEVQDMEFVQFHPTAFYRKGSPSFLISEAVRGEGAYLLNANGKRFMPYYDSLKELAPRDVVAKSIYRETIEKKFPNVYLDLRHLNEKKIKEKFPNIVEFLEEQLLDFTKDLIPVAPAAHYTMGGIKTDVNGRTSIKGLYACGECASNGVHGANRLASNSLLECIVFSERAVTDAVNSFQFKRLFKQYPESLPITIDEKQNDYFKFVRANVADILENYAGILRSKNNLTAGLEKIRRVKNEPGIKRELNFLRAKGLLTISEMIFNSALLRKESRGAHQREDFPEMNSKFRGHFVINNEKIFFEEEIERAE